MGRILLTGATGFVGRQILKVLESQGHKTRIVVRQAGENALRFQ